MFTIQKQKQCQYFDEITVANFSFCQIIVPSTTNLTPRRLGATEVLVPKRTYAAEGQIIVDGTDVAALQGLTFEAIAPEGTPFKIPERLGPAIPLSFESYSEIPLPQAFLNHASMTCRIPGTVFPFYAIFRRIRPRFVRTYDTTSALSPADIVEVLLAEETQFVADNYSHLQNVAFYREQFGL